MVDLKKIANEIRKNIIRQVYWAESGHPGGSLSAVEILTLLYFEKMNIDPKTPQMKNRDRFVLSKGHATPLLYATLAQRGYFDKEWLKTFREINSNLQGHPNMNKTPGVDISTGSLGLGISSAVGMALASKLDKKNNYIYVLLGDGETQEGIVWEAAMSAAHYKLDNLIVFLDYNSLQIDGNIEDVMCPCPLDDKYRSFGWNVIEVDDGHAIDKLRLAVELAQANKGKPSIIIAKTIKGKGVSYMENDPGWHGKAPNKGQIKQAMKELGGTL